MKPKKGWYDKLFDYHEADKELEIEFNELDNQRREADPKGYTHAKPTLHATKAAAEAATRRFKAEIIMLEKDLERLHEDYDAGKEEIRKLKHGKKAQETIITRLHGEIQKRDATIGNLMREIKELTGKLSPDNVLHTRKLPDIQLKRHAHRRSEPDYGDL